MTHHQDPPGRFPDFTDWGRFWYYVRIARRRLSPWGLQYHAEDVVISACDRWSRMVDSPPNARFEMVIRSESWTRIRSYQRSQNREDTYNLRLDPFQCDGALRAYCELRLAVVQQARAENVPLTETDLEVLELHMAGLNQAEIRRVMDLSRRQYNGSRDRLRVVLRPILDP